MNIIVTGASRGIGAGLVTYFVKEGHQVLGISRNRESLEALKGEVSSITKGGSFNYLAMDLSETETNDAIVSYIRSHWGNVDRLVNNAGQLVQGSFEEMEKEAITRMFDINLFAPARLIGTLIPCFKGSDAGHIVNISSMGGYQGSAKFSGLSYYSASKAALACLTECLAEEYRESGVKFNCLALGAVQTEMLEEAFPGYEAPVDATTMARYIGSFTLNGQEIYNGKVLPVSLSTP